MGSKRHRLDGGEPGPLEDVDVPEPLPLPPLPEMPRRGTDAPEESSSPSLPPLPDLPSFRTFGSSDWQRFGVSNGAAEPMAKGDAGGNEAVQVLERIEQLLREIAG